MNVNWTVTGISYLALAEHALASQPIRLDEGERVEKPGAEPKWQKLFPLGVTKHRGDFPGGKLEFSRAMLATLVLNAKGIIGKGHQIQVNYHHLGGDQLNPALPLENTVAAGWIQDVELRHDGAWALMEWTERARKFIEANELKYLSPEFYLDYQNRDTGKLQGPTLVGAALTNTPFLKELPRVAATDSPPKAEPSADTGAKRMDKKLICAALGLPEDAADENVLAKLNEVVEAGKKLTLADSQATEMKATAVKLTEEAATLRKENTDLKTEKRAVEVKAFCDTLQQAGKLTGAIRPHVEKLGIAGGVEAIKFFEEAAPVVQLGEVGIPGDPKPEDKKQAVQKRLNARVAEIQKADSTVKFRDAHALAMSEMPEARPLFEIAPK